MNQLPARLGQEAGAQPLLPLPLAELVAAIKASDAVDAFAAKRAVQILQHGHSAEADLAQPIGHLANEAKARLHALMDFVGGRNGRMNLPGSRRDQCIRYIDTAGALLIALRERVAHEVGEE